MKDQLDEIRKLLDMAGIEHSGLTQVERVERLIEERDHVRKILIKQKVKQNRGEK